MWPVLVLLLLAGTTKNYNVHQSTTMKLNAGIVTPHLEASRNFYSKILGFGVVFESDWYLLMHSPDGAYQLAFLVPDHPSQHPLFRPVFKGEGLFLTIETEDVDAMYERMQQLGVPVTIPIRNEAWGDRHFAITDPNGVGIDIVHYTTPVN